MKEYIRGYMRYLNTSSEDKLQIPPEYVLEFWSWFESNAKLYNGIKIRKNLKPTVIDIQTNMCFKNSYRISIAFVKRYFLYEGFAFRNMDKSYLKHSFNVDKQGKVTDFSLFKNSDNNLNYGVYVGVKIPLSFARMFYEKNTRKKDNFTQHSLLVAYFLYRKKDNQFLDYSKIY